MSRDEKLKTEETVKLAELVNLEQLERGLYRGQSWDLGFRALFGGQVLAQALMAATHTVEEGRFCHSFHSYFLLPGDASKPVVYDVENVRDGKSFSARRIKAIQNGNSIFYMTASFQLQQDGVEHQYAQFPQGLPPPESLQPDIKQYEANIDKLPAKLSKALIYHKPLDIRSIPDEVYAKDSAQPVRAMWLKANELLPASFGLNSAALAYASDYHFLTTVLKPHNLSLNDPSVTLATIDHAMWFHRRFNLNDWLLYTVESPLSGHARGFVRGQFFNRQGQLVASAAQEGVVRN